VVFEGFEQVIFTFKIFIWMWSSVCWQQFFIGKQSAILPCWTDNQNTAKTLTIKSVLYVEAIFSAIYCRIWLTFVQFRHNIVDINSYMVN
jgi:hypothetical protein